MKARARALLSLISDEDGQATTEYLLIMAVIMVLLVSLIKNAIQPIFEKLKARLAQQLDRALFGGDMHQLRVGH